MKRSTIHLLFYIQLFSLSFLVSCTQNVSDPKDSESTTTPKQAISLKIEAENFVAASDDVSKEEGHISTSADESWISFDVNIQEAGRYKFELNASAQTDQVTAWMEDYIDNKDGRTYNITGDIPISKNNSFTTSGKDGSPLNKGLHKMKLHLKGGSAKIDWINFSLIRKHQLTPKTLTQKMDGKDWNIVWSDEFEGEGMPDTSKWTYDIGDWGWGNNELQYYTENRPENARLENGHLVIEARKNDNGRAWTSARLTTRGKETFLYGRIEFRAKVPVKRGNWAAGWTLGDDYVDEISWPYCGEIDILESVGYQMNDTTGNGKAHASIHCGAYYFKLGNQPTASIDVENMNKEYHIYSMDWTPEGITASVDGNVYFTYNDTSTALAWPYNKPQNIILNLAIGGGWGGLEGLDESMTSQQFLIDYVRVYERR